MLKARQLTAVRGDRCLFSQLSFSVDAGELLYVRGVNGSGKTTLLRMLSGLTQPADGEIEWDGRPIGVNDDRFCQDVFYLGHSAAIKDDLDAVENLRTASALAGQSIDYDEARKALAIMGLGDHYDLPSRVLSQGQRRRVALARLLNAKARLWILDEPFTALDTVAVDHLMASIREHLARGGVVVLTTHQLVDFDSVTSRELRIGRA
ncbi:MAG: cytochrome c biogenesis heme-transporting ATPase CcmA [Gammaproteobacteria bacterium]|nr:cytochrome c biogenesis heme-transporting ATPase CcmA [Gammaproteobacteria bacterium]